MSADNLPVVRPSQDARNLSRVVRAAVRLEYDPATTKMLTGIADDLDKIADRATTTEEMLARSAERIKKLENTMTVLAIFFHASSNHPGYWGQCEDIECTGYRNVLSVEKQS